MEARAKCWARIPEKKFIMSAQQRLELELRKTFEQMKFKDIYEWEVKASRYEKLMKEVERKILIYGTYYQETVDVDMDIAEFVFGEPIVCDVIAKKNVKTLKKSSL
jgi:hypothetical protein